MVKHQEHKIPSIVCLRKRKETSWCILCVASLLLAAPVLCSQTKATNLTFRSSFSLYVQSRKLQVFQLPNYVQEVSSYCL